MLIRSTVELPGCDCDRRRCALDVARGRTPKAPNATIRDSARFEASATAEHRPSVGPAGKQFKEQEYTLMSSGRQPWLTGGIRGTSSYFAWFRSATTMYCTTTKRSTLQAL